MQACVAVQRDGTRPPTETLIAFIDDQRVVYGVESICRVLPIAPSTYYHRLACQADPSKASARQQRDTDLRLEIKRVWDENYQVYGVRKAWHQMKREGFELARCTVERLKRPAQNLNRGDCRLRRTSAGARAGTRHCCHPGQSCHAQECRRCQSHARSRMLVPVPAALQPRPEPN